MDTNTCISNCVLWNRRC